MRTAVSRLTNRLISLRSRPGANILNCAPSYGNAHCLTHQWTLFRRLCYFVYMTTQDATSSATLSVRLSSRTKHDLGRLASATKRTKSFLASEAIEAFVAREMEIIEGINRGLADMRAGRVIPHDEAMRKARQAIERALEEKS